MSICFQNTNQNQKRRKVENSSYIRQSYRKNCEIETKLPSLDSSVCRSSSSSLSSSSSCSTCSSLSDSTSSLDSKISENLQKKQVFSRINQPQPIKISITAVRKPIPNHPKIQALLTTFEKLKPRLPRNPIDDLIAKIGGPSKVAEVSIAK